MSVSPAPSSEILVRTIGMDARKEAVFRMAFKMHSRRRYRLLDDGEGEVADLAIVDIDGPGGMQIFEAFRTRHMEVPVLIVALAAPANPPAPCLPKPIRMETLFPALEALLRGETPAVPAWSQPTPAVPAAAARSNVTPIRPDLQTPVTPIPAAPAEAPTPPPAAKPVPILRPEDIRYFDPDQGLLGILHMARRDRAAVSIIEGSRHVLMTVDPVVDQVFILVDDDTLQGLCEDPHARLHARAAQPADVPAGADVRQLSFQALLWQVAAFSSQGRLPKNIRPNTPLQLKHWPNLTRLPALPESLRLAAFLARSPVSPALTVKMLRVQPADLFNFLAAADSQDLLRYRTGDETPASASATGAVAAGTLAQEIPSARRGFLSRLLAKIAGL